MKQLFYIAVLLIGSVSFSQIQPNTKKLPNKKVNTTNQTKIPTEIIQPNIPIVQAPRKIVLVSKPTLAGSWTNTNGNMIYFYKSAGNNIYFFAEEKNINPSWSIVGKAIPAENNVYRFDYGFVTGTGTTSFDNWILNDELVGNFMNSRDNMHWKPYSRALVRSNTKYTPPAPTPSTSVMVASSKLNESGIFTSLHRDFMWQMRIIGDKVLMFGETVSGQLIFFATGTKQRLTEEAQEAYMLNMELTDVVKQRTHQYKFKYDKHGISYVRSSDCYKSMDEPLRYCPDGFVLGRTERTIPLALYDLNRTADARQNIERNRRYFDYHAPASVNEDNRMKDADGDGHNSLAYNGDDCDDTDPNKFPGNPEIADFEGNDEDCNPDTIGVLDRDGDGYTDWRVYNKDDKGRILKRGDDCDDNDRSVHPGGSEVCDGKDNDCDGDVDEGVSHLYYRDNDNDGFGDPNERLGTKACYKPSGYADNNRDCDDSDRTKTTNCN